LSRALLVALGVAVVAALLSVIVAAYMADNLGAQRANSRGRFHNGAPPFARQRRQRPLAIAALERRKYETPACDRARCAEQVLPTTLT